MVVRALAADAPSGRRSGRRDAALGGYFTATQIVFHLLTNVDKVLVGFMLGREALGYYSQAFTVMMKPVVVLTTPLTSVMLPALSRSVHDRAHYAQIVLAFQRLLAVASFPAGVGLILVARETMVVLGGPQWAEAGRLLEVLAAAVLVQGFITMAGTIFISAGRFRAMLVGSLVMLVVLVQGLLVGYFVGRTYGDATLGVAWGYALTMCIPLFLPYMLFCLRMVGVSPWAWSRQLVWPGLAALAMGAIVFAARRRSSGSRGFRPWASSSRKSRLGGGVYAAFAWREIRWCLDRLRRF